MTQDDMASGSVAGPGGNNAMASASGTTVAGGHVMSGTSTTSMANQYNRPAAGPSGTGASSWVAASPPPAFVATGPAPAADAPTPPPAAVANRQPSAASTPAPRPAVAASDIVRPEAQTESAPELQASAQAQPAARAQASAQPAALSAADLAKGRQIFANYSCGACHVLADAGGSGSIGPGLDRNPNLTQAYAAGIIHDGRGAMPSFAGQITDADIQTLAAYIVQVSRK